MYYFEYEAHLTTGIVANELPAVLNIPRLPMVEINRWPKGEQSQNYADQRHTFKVTGFSSEGEAAAAARKLGDALLVHGAVRGLGIRFLNCTANGTPEIKKVIGGAMEPMRVFASGSVEEPLRFLDDGLKKWTSIPGEFSKQQRTCLRLLNDYHFTRMWESKLVLAVSAVEALCGKTKLDETFQFAVKELSEHLNRIEISDPVREELNKKISNLDQMSIGQGYRKKIRSLLTEKDAKKFKRIYNERSKFVHTGLVGSKLQDLAISAQEIAVRLILAELNHVKNTKTE